jgi:hypothetical protein
MTDNRPKEIGVWMKTCRTWMDIDIADIDMFSAAWWSWWKALQPDVRTCETAEDMIAPTDDMDWRKLKKLGKNELPLVMVTLSWWGRASSCGTGWKTAIQDVFDSITCMHRSISSQTTSPDMPLGGLSGANVEAGRPVREHKRVPARDEGYEEQPRKKAKSRR